MRSHRGYTLMEVLVSTSIAMLVSAMALSTFVTHKTVFQQDLERIKMRQNLRGALDILGANIRLAGESLPASFPALELIDGSPGADTLIMRRALFPEVLKVCTALSSGSSSSLHFALAGTTPGCTYGDQLQNFTVWTSYLTSEGGEAKGYIHDPAGNNGELFTFQSVVDTGVEYYVQLSPGESWTNAYPVGLSAAYIVEEWAFSLNSDTLTLIENEDGAQPLPVTAEVEDFQVSIELTDGTIVDTFDTNQSWTDIAKINITLRSRHERSAGDLVLEQQASFFPRNILSH